MAADKHIEGIGNPGLPVKLVPDFDFTNAVISSQEGFVLSRVDGESDVETLCLSTGLGPNTTLECIRRLRAQGIIVVGDEPPVRSEIDATGGRLVGESVRVPRLVGDEEDEDEGPEPEGDADVDLKPEVRKRVREVYRKLGKVSYFALLGVDLEADYKTIRRAYFKRSKEFHPDRFYTKKNLGRYKEMLDQIFKQVASAYKYLEKEDNRIAYRLALKRNQRASQPAMDPVKPPSRPSQPAVAAAPASASTPSPGRRKQGLEPEPALDKGGAPAEEVDGTGEYTYTKAKGLRRREVVQTSDALRIPPELLARTPGRRTPTSTEQSADDEEAPGGQQRPSSPQGGDRGAQGGESLPEPPSGLARPRQVTGPPRGMSPAPSAPSTIPPRRTQTTGPDAPSPRPRHQSAQDLERLRPLPRREEQRTGPFEPVGPKDEAEAARRAADRKRRRRFRTMSTPAVGKKKKAEEHYQTALKQLESGKALAAAASLKLAMSFDPDEPKYNRKYEEAMDQTRDSTADGLYKRALYEESVGKLDLAGKFFMRAADVHPGGNYQRKAMEYALRVEDLIKAKEYGTKAVQAEPENVDGRLLLARVYIAAGLRKNAQREVEQAIKLEPGNPEAKALSKEIKRL